MLSTGHQWFICIRLSVSYLTRSSLAFSVTLTTMTFDHSRLRRFKACFRKPTLRDLPSSHTYIAWRTVVRVTHEVEPTMFQLFVKIIQKDVG